MGFRPNRLGRWQLEECWATEIEHTKLYDDEAARTATKRVSDRNNIV